MKWMHISDIHMNKEFNHVMSGILREDIPDFITRNRITVDYLFVTGDYRDSEYMKDGTLSEDMYLQAANVSEYILSIAQALNISADQIYLVPGNHDLNRQEEDKNVIGKIKESYHQYRESLNETEQEYLLGRFDFFNLIDQHIHPEAEAGHRASHRFYHNEKADILCLNTAITCYGEETERELILNSEYIRKITGTPQRKTPFIVLAHHDLKFLTEREEENLKCILRNMNIIFRRIWGGSYVRKFLSRRIHINWDL